MLMGEPAVEMRRRLASSGLALDEDLNQLPDHLCIEIEYLYFLLGEGRKKGHESQLTKAKGFAGDWMLPWVRQFHDQLAKADDETGFYTLVSGLLVELLTAIAG
jgi:TorA-specific chaperone